MPSAFEFPFFFSYPPYFTCAHRNSCLACLLRSSCIIYSLKRSAKAFARLCRLQPVKETRQKQISLWTELILKYCKHQKVCCRPHYVLCFAVLCQVQGVCAAEHTGSASLSVTALSAGVVQDFILSTDAADDHPLFVNKAIDSAPAHSRLFEARLGILSFSVFASTEPLCSAPGRLNREARVYILNELVQQGVAPVLLLWGAVMRL